MAIKLGLSKSGQHFANYFYTDPKKTVKQFVLTNKSKRTILLIAF